MTSVATARQYHGQTSQKPHRSALRADPDETAILRSDSDAVSPPIAISIGLWKSSSIGKRKWSQTAVDRVAIPREAASGEQYQPRKGRYRLVIGLALALGAVYVGFLAVWYWATRIRPRAVDTNRRML